MSNTKRKRAQAKLLDEIKDQLVLQADRWGKKGHYDRVRLEEMVLEQCHRVAGDLMSEKANLEYELYLLDSNKRDLLIKMERLQYYIGKASRVIDKHEQNIKKQLDKLIASKDKLDLIMKHMRPESNISVLISSN